MSLIKYIVSQLEHPNTIMFRKNEYYSKPVTEMDVYNWYKKHAKDIVDSLKGYPVMIVVRTDHGDIIKKHSKEDGIEIKDINQFNEELNRGRYIEFHRILRDKEPFGYVDIDPHGDVDWSLVKRLTNDLVSFLKKKYKRPIKVYFSGNRGFHIYIIFDKLRDIDQLRKELRDYLNEFIEEYGYDDATTGLAKNGQIRLDVTTLHKGGSLRVPFSLHKKTGLAAIPVTNIKHFKPEMAKITGGNSNEYSKQGRA